MTNSGEMSVAGKVWFITGASTGFGYDLAEYLLASGATVVATARRPETLDALTAKYPKTALKLALDVTRQEQIDEAVKAALTWFGKIDVLVNNAGYGMVGSIEESHAEEYEPMFDTNVFGLVRVTQAVLPHMRERKTGYVVNFSSIGGLIGIPGFGMYNASKFAVEGLSEALAQELKPLGIGLTIVEPGPFRTEFLGRSYTPAANRIEDYDQTAGKMRKYAEDQNGKQPGDPKRAVVAIVKAVTSANPPLRLMLGANALPRFQAKLDAQLKDIADWKDTTIGADFPAGE
jgi:NADP-dependent 3-hydroxy acid dehydrogenase YdfG